MSVTILRPLSASGEKLRLYAFHVPAGFPSLAADHIERHISLDELFDIRAPHAYLVKIEGDSMQGAGIYCGDLVIVDRSKERNVRARVGSDEGLECMAAERRCEAAVRGKLRVKQRG